MSLNFFGRGKGHISKLFPDGARTWQRKVLGWWARTLSGVPAATWVHRGCHWPRMERFLYPSMKGYLWRLYYVPDFFFLFEYTVWLILSILYEACLWRSQLFGGWHGLIMINLFLEKMFCAELMSWFICQSFLLGLSLLRLSLVWLRGMRSWFEIQETWVSSLSLFGWEMFWEPLLFQFFFLL